jgi:hypothetical protein
MSEDITKQPIPAPRAKLPDEETDYAPSDCLEAQPYPWQVTAAGVIWVVLGALILFLTGLMLVSAVSRPGGANAGGQNNGAISSGLLTWLGCMAVFGASLMLVGVHSIRGTLRNLGTNIVLSFGLSLLYLGPVIVKVAGGQFIQPGVGRIILTGVDVLIGVLLLAAGLLALMGRRQYEQWRKMSSTRLTRFYKQKLPIGDEQLLKESPANLVRTVGRVGGWLYLTDQRLLFQPHRFNTNKDELSIPLLEIEEVGDYAVAGWIPTGLQITTSEGLRRFVINVRGAWIKAIKDARGFHS